MKFGPVPVEESAGCILAHSLKIEGTRLKKGRCLSESDVRLLREAGFGQVTVASLEPHDLGEDEAARRIADALLAGTEGLTCTAPFTGRVNLHAAAAGIVEIDAERVFRINSIDDRITLATLAKYDRVAPRSLVATVKVITYAVAEDSVARAQEAASGALRLRRPVRGTASLILTQTVGQPAHLVRKGEKAVSARLDALGVRLADTHSVAHESGPVCRAISRSAGDMVLLLTGSATSDSEDVGPSALRMAGGKLLRFGMPVDPGNLLFLGDVSGRPVIGLPGCARSPALNGADWVLERIACGINVGSRDIAAMGTGGLLKEIPTRPHSRTASASVASRPFVEAAVIDNGGLNALRRMLDSALQSRADRVRLVSAGRSGSQTAAEFPDVSAVAVPSGTGRTGLIRAAAAAADPSAAAVLLIPADGPAATSDQLDRLIAAFSPSDGREICRIAQPDGRQRPPVLFGRRFFESLAELSGSGGAAPVAAEAGEFTAEIQP